MLKRQLYAQRVSGRVDRLMPIKLEVAGSISFQYKKMFCPHLELETTRTRPYKRPKFELLCGNSRNHA